MIKKITLLLILTSINLFSQEKIKGNGIVTVVKENLDPYNKIILKNDFKVILIKADAPAIEIETDENIHEAINYFVSDGTLVLQTDQKIRPKKALNITIFCTYNLKEVELQDDIEIETLSTINVDEMLLKINDYAKADFSIKANKFKLINKNNSKIQLRSKSKINIDSPSVDLMIGASSTTSVIVKSDSLNVNLKDKATLELEGMSDYLNAMARDNTNFKGRNFNVKESHIITKNNSELSIQAFDKITIEASEKSEIELYGNAKIELEKFADQTKLHKKELSNK